MNRAVLLLLGLATGWCALYKLRTLGLEWVPVGNIKTIHVLVMCVGALLILARAARERTERATWTLIGLAFLGWTGGEIYFTRVLWDVAQPPVPSWARRRLPLAAPAALRRPAAAAPEPDPRSAADPVGGRHHRRARRRRRQRRGRRAGGARDGGRRQPGDLHQPRLSARRPRAARHHRRRARRRRLAPGSHLRPHRGRRRAVLAGRLGLPRPHRAGHLELGRTTEVGWWGAALLFAAAAWLPGRRTSSANRQRGAVVIAMPTAFATVALAVLVAGSLGTLNPIAVVLATASLGAVMLRLVLTFEQHGRTLNTLRHQALHDALTGLPNRALFEDRLRQALARGHRHGGRAAVLLLDLDDFKPVNDTLGHDAGDELLDEVGAPAARRAAPGGHVARLGGDEFARRCCEADRRRAHADRARRAPARRRSRAPVVARRPASSSSRASIGIAVSDGGDGPPTSSLRDADVAMYARQGRGHEPLRASSTPSMHAARARAAATCEGELRRALERDELAPALPADRRPRQRRRRRRRGAACAGSTPSAGCSAPASSSRWPRRPA